MSLTREDLEKIRGIVRDELARLLAPDEVHDLEERARVVADRLRPARSDAGEIERDAIRALTLADAAALRERSDRRAAQPIPNTPYLDVGRLAVVGHSSGHDSWDGQTRSPRVTQGEGPPRGQPVGSDCVDGEASAVNARATTRFLPPSFASCSKALTKSSARSGSTRAR